MSTVVMPLAYKDMAASSDLASRRWRWRLGTICERLEAALPVPQHLDGDLADLGPHRLRSRGLTDVR